MTFQLWLKRKFAVIENIGVHPDHRQQGLATALMKSAEEWAKEKGAHNMELKMSIRSIQMHNFYIINLVILQFHKK